MVVTGTRINCIQRCPIELHRAATERSVVRGLELLHQRRGARGGERHGALCHRLVTSSTLARWRSTRGIYRSPSRVARWAHIGQSRCSAITEKSIPARRQERVLVLEL